MDGGGWRVMVEKVMGWDIGGGGKEWRSRGRRAGLWAGGGDLQAGVL